MPIKQLQLRGISRTPSDRATADGGCAESLNVHIDQQETAPTLPPLDISSDIFPATMPAGEKKHVIRFIHKMKGIVNYIGFHPTDRTFRAYGDTLSATIAGTDYDGLDIMGGAALGEGESLTYVTSIGNTLIVYSDAKPYYFLFKDGRYVALGNAIPQPAVEIASVPFATEESVIPLIKVEEGSLAGNSNVSEWNHAAQPEDGNHDEFVGTVDNIWAVVTGMTNHFRQKGVFCAPFFIRYALRLYDGKYIYTSSPILCGGAAGADWFTATLDGNPPIYETFTAYYFTKVAFNNLFKVYVRGSFAGQSWGDLVKSIDFFASTPIYTPAVDAQGVGMKADYTFTFEGMDEDTRDKTIKDAVLSKGQFYKVASVDVANTVDMADLESGRYTIAASDTTNGEALPLQDELPDGYRDGNQYIPSSGAQNYNNRLMLVGSTETLSRGDMFLSGQVAAAAGSSSSPEFYRYALRYKIVDSLTGESHYVFAHYYDGGKQMYPACYVEHGGTVRTGLCHGDDIPSARLYRPCQPYAWLSYPDTRCKQVEVFYYTVSGTYEQIGKAIPMEAHPLLECAYAFLGFGVSLRDLANSTKYQATAASRFYEDDTRVIESRNKLYLSEFENPFLFPAGNILTFPDDIVGVAGITVPLSEGQVGDFSVYAFTEGGIRSLIPTAEGTFAATMAHPNLSRHIAKAGTILSLEQSIIFTTERGVMMLSGGSVTELSRNMVGRHYILEQEVRAMLLSSEWQGILGPTNDGDPFMAFMASARPAYDNNGARLIFFAPAKQYQYVYMLETQTWHKAYTSIANPVILNSYPDCLVSWNPNNNPTVLDFTTALADYPADAPVRGIIATRPFDLDAPDIRKAIRSIRIRGDYNRGDVQYILLGSMDGHSWKRLSSLRGGSYKLFRLVMLTNLTPTERISWIDVDYETRLTDRLR